MSVTIYCGPMFAGKSKTLIHNAKKFEKKLGADSILMIKYAKDTRYTNGTDNIYVISHDNEKYPARPVNKLMELSDSDLVKYKRIFIDEGQFFPDLKEFIIRIRGLGLFLNISGLDLNHKREHFGQMAEAMQMSDVIVKLQAVCSDCKGSATYTRMNTVSNELRNAEIVVGGAELYSPVCADCYVDIQ